MVDRAQAERQQRAMSWAVGAAALVGFVLMVTSVLAGWPTWIPWALAVLTGLKTALAIVLFRREWIGWPAGDGRCRGVIFGNPAFGGQARCRLRAGHDGRCRP